MVVVKSDNFTVPRGDFGYNLDFTVYEADGSTVKNLSGYTLRFITWEEGVSGTKLVDAAATITVAADGTCYYTVVSGDFDDVAAYKYVIQGTKSGIQESIKSGWITVTENP